MAIFRQALDARTRSPVMCRACLCIKDRLSEVVHGQAMVWNANGHALGRPRLEEATFFESIVQVTHRRLVL